MIFQKPSDLKPFMHDRIITSVAQFKKEYLLAIQMVKNSSSFEWLEFFRGHVSDEWKLIPGISRNQTNIIKLRQLEEEIKEEFHLATKKELSKFISNEIFSDPQSRSAEDWYLQFQAQHLGLKTRLLDWSIDWRVGLFFAVNDPNFDSRDGNLWIFFCPKKWRHAHEDRSRYLETNYLKNEDNLLINHPFSYLMNDNKIIGEENRARQSGRFFNQSLEQSITPLEDQAEVSEFLIKFIIDRNAKIKIRKELMEIGLIQDTVYYKSLEPLDILTNKIREINEKFLF